MLVTSIAVIHLAFLNPSLVEVRSRSGNPNGSVIASLRVFGGEDGLRMQRRRHVDALGVAVGALERDVFGGEIGADAFEEHAQVRPGPLADVVPALDADVADDHLLLGQLVDLSSTVHGRLSPISPLSSSFQPATSTGLTSSMS